jgi:1-acyl-sn-glycerol-3-phosphate acyltransferase
MTYLRSWLFWSYLLLSSAVLWLVAVILFLATFAFDRRRRLLHLYTSLWAYHYVFALPLWSAHFQGKNRIDAEQTYIYCVNHQSLGDILIMFGLFRHFKWVSKRNIFRVPFIGWNMHMNDYVSLVRGDKISIEAMMKECRRHLKMGSSIMMFPESTRSTNGQIKQFKLGAFQLAKELNLPVAPIVIEGTCDALPKHGLLLEQRAMLPIYVRILEPIPADAAASEEALCELVRDRMVEGLAMLRADVATYGENFNRST